MPVSRTCASPTLVLSVVVVDYTGITDDSVMNDLQVQISATMVLNLFLFPVELHAQLQHWIGGMTDACTQRSPCKDLMPVCIYVIPAVLGPGAVLMETIVRFGLGG